MGTEDTCSADTHGKAHREHLQTKAVLITNRSCSHLSRDFNSDFIKNLIHNVLAFFFIIRTIKDVIKGVIDLERKGTKIFFKCVTS